MARIRVPLLWPGLILSGLLLLLMFLQGAGLRLGSQSSALAMGLTCTGLALAFGYLMAGATAGGWAARAVVLAALAAAMFPVRAAMTRGYSGYLLLAGLLIFLAWRWRQKESHPVLDFLGSGVIVLLTYTVISDRSSIFGHASDGQSLFQLMLSAQAFVLGLAAGVVLQLIGAGLGDAGLEVTHRFSIRLAQLPSGLLAGVTMAAAFAKLLWDGSRYAGSGWGMALLVGGFMSAWIWAAWPRPADSWPRRMPAVIGAVALAMVLMKEFGVPELGGLHTPVQGLMIALYAAGFAALALGVGALLLGRRPAALVAGLAGIWLLFATANGEVHVTVPVLSALSHLPKLDGIAVDGVLHLALAAWVAWLWLRGRRDPVPYAISLMTVPVSLGFNAIDKVIEQDAALLILLLITGAALYCLWLIHRGATRRQGRGGVVWTGLGVGLFLLTATAGYWTDLSGAADGYFAPGSMATLGWGMFAYVIYGTGLLRQFHRLTAERGDRA